MSEPFDIAKFLPEAEPERTARLRSLGVCVRLLTRHVDVRDAIRALERGEEGALEAVNRRMTALPALVFRNVLATWAASWGDAQR